MQRRYFSYLLVAVQFAALLLLVVSSSGLPRRPLSWLVALLGFAIGGWALLAMRLDRLAILPDVKDRAELVWHGPYRWIRHPMYTSLLLVGLAVLVENPQPWRWGIWFVLLANQCVKLLYEERLLLARFPEYETYMARTKRLIPFIV